MANDTRHHKGFTIVELLVSAVVAILMIIIIGSAFTLNQKVFRASNTKAELTQNARIVEDLMSRELRQAKKMVTTLPVDNSNPSLVPHELEFQDGHIDNQIEYIRYYLNGTNIQRQIIVYYFSTDPSTYVYFDDVNAFGPPQTQVLEDKVIGENFTSLNFYGSTNITIDVSLGKNNEVLQMQSIINPRNI